jgi:hypothetical protein
MNRSQVCSALSLATLFVTSLSACGSDAPKSRFKYTDPDGGALRLIKRSADATSITLDFVVGKQPLNGYSTGFTLPLNAKLVELGAFTPGTALDAGSEPVAAKGMIAADGPLANMLVTAQSQKADGQGAVVTNTDLAPGTVLYSIKLALAADSAETSDGGVVFDGTAAGFALPSGGLRDKIGITVVPNTEVAIGKLEVTK